MKEPRREPERAYALTGANPIRRPPRVCCDRWLPLAWSRCHGFRPVPFAMMVTWHAAHDPGAIDTPDLDTSNDAVAETEPAVTLPPTRLGEFLA
jgi:hypothetical protein